MGGFGGGRLGIDIAGSAMRLAQKSRETQEEGAGKERGEQGVRRCLA